MNLIRLNFQHDIAYGDFKDLARRTASDKVLRDKSFNIARNRKYEGYQRGLSSMVYKFFDKKSVGRGVNMHANNEHPLDLAEELHKPITRKFKKKNSLLKIQRQYLKCWSSRYAINKQVY